MTKDEELSMLDKIERIIAECGADSYIGITFAGIGDVCKQNIYNDFADNPIENYKAECARNLKKDAEMGATLRKVELERDVLRSEVEALKGKIADRDHIIDAKDAELARLRAEVQDLRKDDAGVDEYVDELRNQIRNLKAELYDYMKGAKKNA